MQMPLKALINDNMVPLYHNLSKCLKHFIYIISVIAEQPYKLGYMIMATSEMGG